MQKIGLILGETVFILLRFSEVLLRSPLPPLFQNPTYDTIGNNIGTARGPIPITIFLANKTKLAFVACEVP